MKTNKAYDYIIIGSGFGGAFAAYNLAKAGKEVLVVERGKWVTRDDSCWDEIKLHVKNPMYRGQTDILADQKKGKVEQVHTDDTVGGMSTLYGGVAFRMREQDFKGLPLPDTDKQDAKSAWPIGYNALAPFYDEAEKLQGIAGIKGADPVEPPRKYDYVHAPHEVLSTSSKKIYDAAKGLGLHPFLLPLAINFSGEHGKAKCVPCNKCDHYLCKIEAKNDLSVVVLPDAIKHGATVMADARAIKINCRSGKAESVDVADQSTGNITAIKAKNVIVACGALATPHLLLSSGIEGSLIGRNLVRHCNGAVASLMPYRTNPNKMFQKQIGITDFYYGMQGKQPLGTWGNMQDIQNPGKGVAKMFAPFGLKNLAAIIMDYMINLLCMAEDIAQLTNRVYIDNNKKDKFGMPALLVYHRYHPRDIQALEALYGEAKKILRKAGGLFFYKMPIDTFSHAFGTCRMGRNKGTSVLDPDCRLWDMKNIYVLDAGALPCVGSVNPSLTIAANALRVSKMLAKM